MGGPLTSRESLSASCINNVVLTGIEGWVEVDEVDGLVGDVVAEDFEVVAVVELVFRVRHALG